MDRVIGIITANYKTEDLDALTRERTIASLPYGGRYRLIDFPLSNMVNSGITTIGLITPYKYRSIIDHIGAGSDWDLDRKNGGLFILPGSASGISTSSSRFILKDLVKNSVYLMRSPAEYVLVTSANIVSNMDYSELCESHIASGADITLAYNIAEEEDENITGIRSKDGKVTAVTEGVKEGQEAFLDSFVISRKLLLQIIEGYSNCDYLDLFEALAEHYDKMNVRLYEYKGYVRRIFTVKSYFEGNMELLDAEISNELFNRKTPILTKAQDSVPTKYMAESDVKNCLISAGCAVSGTVENSILFRHVTVKAGAVVRNSIIMQNCTIEEGAYIENAIIDRRNVIQAGTVIKGSKDAIFIKEKNLVEV